MEDLKDIKVLAKENSKQIVELRIQVVGLSDKTLRHEKIIDRVSNLLLGAFITALIGSVYYFIQNGGQ